MTEKLREIFTTLIPIALLTCLIWIYAEQISTDTAEETVNLRITAPANSPLLPQLAETPGKQLKVQAIFSGPQGQLEVLRKELRIGKFAPEYIVRQSGTLQLNTAEIIEQQIPSRYQAVTILQAIPEKITVNVDQLVTKPIPVRVLTGAVKTTDPTVSPQPIDVTLPESFYENLPQQDRVIYINLENKLQNLGENQIVDSEFPVPQTLAGRQVKTSPKKVTIRLQVRKEYTTKSYTFNRIKVLGPIDLLEDYSVIIKDKEITIALRGPADILENLKKQDIIPYIKIEEDDKNRRSLFPRPVQINLPENLKNQIQQVTTAQVVSELVEKQN